jgi:hypothetical protein
VRGLGSQLSQPFNQRIRLQDIQDTDHIDREGKTIQGRMQNLVEETAKDIENCGSVCNAFGDEKVLGM